MLYLEFAHYLSPSPLLLTRPSRSNKIQESYLLSDSISLRLLAKIGDGAAGDVFRATFELPTPSYSVTRSADSVVVKISTKAHDPIRNEYAIYCHLAAQVPVMTGIPSCLGLFDSRESPHVVLVLSDCGEPLARFLERDDLSANEMLVFFKYPSHLPADMALIDRSTLT